VTDRARWVPVYIVALLVVAGALAVSGHDTAVQPHIQASPATREPVPDLVGEWEGTWEDTVFHVVGGLSWEISRNVSDFSATGVIDMSYFVMGDVPGTASGSLTGRPPDETLTFAFGAATVGDGSGTIVGTAISGAGIMINPSFGPFTFVGTVSDTVIRGTFDFTGPGQDGAGKAILTKNTPVEPSSWGGVKARFRDDSE